ncbi:LegC family aminotransferase [Candidatus Pelagibacter sp. HIMB1623]|uniref:LegC family aminotransferase n=1 Tax=Candidatus Pelagibacter sp. HIMB1623 TaxID=3413358 RepID=UPI003F83BF8F
MFKDIVEFIQKIYQTKDFISLHEPKFVGKEKEYIEKCIESTFVSSVGIFVNKLEIKIAKYTGAKYAISTTNGTSALHISLLLAGVDEDCEVITQPLTFIATCNAINYCKAKPVFVDVDRDTMGLSPSALEFFLKNNTKVKNKKCINIKTNKIIKACVPMHSYGHPCKIDKIKTICNKYNIFLIEDAAESLGSFYKNKHTGTFGQIGTLSFNGNKIITAGGGGCIITNDKSLAVKAKHLTTTAKIPHKWDFNHDMIGYNYRMPNLNAALLIAQLEKLNNFIKNKRKLANDYEKFFKSIDYFFFKEPKFSRSNYWLNVILLKNKKQRDKFLDYTNKNGVMTRPAWKLMNKIKMFKDCHQLDLKNANYLEERIVNIPSSVRF